MTDAVQAALAAAKTKTTPTARKKDRLYYTPDETELAHCQGIRNAGKAEKEAKRLRGDHIKALRSTIDAKRTTDCRGGNFQTTAEVECGDFNIQLQYKAVWRAFDESQEGELKKCVGDEKYPQLFQSQKELKLVEATINTPEKLNTLISKLLTVLTPEEFAANFAYTTKIVVGPNFDANRHSMLTPEQNEELVTMGMNQTVTPYVR